MLDKSAKQEVKYNGFATPCLILEGSDKVDRGNIIDRYAKTEEQDGLLCGTWSKGFEDKLIHIYLMNPVPAICDERAEWVAKKMLLKEPVSLNPAAGTLRISNKRQPEINLETGVIKW